MARYLYSELASLIDARQRCMLPSANESQHEHASVHEDTILRLVKDFMPSGSGFDSGTKIDLDASHANKLVFTTSYHHMNDGGYYDGWTDHTVTITPSLVNDFDLRISGRNRNDIKDYMYQTFDQALNEDCEYQMWAYVYDMELTPVWANGHIASWIGKVCTIGSGHGTVDGKPIDAYQTVAENESRETCERLMVEYVKENRNNVRRTA